MTETSTPDERDDELDVGPPSPPTPPSPPRLSEWFSSLTRSTHGRILGGVAAGLARRFGVPVLLVRVVFVAASFIGVGVPLYALAWVLLPTDTGDRVTGHGPIRDLIAVGTVVAACVLLLSQSEDIYFGPLISRTMPWFVVLGGLVLLLRRTEHSATPTREESPVDSLSSSSLSPSAGPRPNLAPARVRPLRRPVVGPLTWSAALLIFGVMGLLFVSGASSVAPGVVAAIVMIVFGAGLTLSAFRGRARGLILPCMALGALLAGLGALNIKADSGEGGFRTQIDVESRLPKQISSLYGDNRLDARNLKLTRDRSVSIRQTSGSLVVVLPRHASSVVTVHAAAGSIYLGRLSAQQSLSNPDVANTFFKKGLPHQGDVAGSVDTERLVNDFWSQHIRLISRDGGQVVVKRSSTPTLSIDIEWGFGQVVILDPSWTDIPKEIHQPEQLCTVGGGPRGVVKPCSQVDASKRVALCINDGGFLVDCREDRPATADRPRVAACRGIVEEFIDCQSVNVTVVGAQLTVDDGSKSTIAPADGESPPSVPTTTTTTTTAPSTAVPTVPTPNQGA